MTAFSEAGDWLVDKAARDMGLQTTCVGGNAHNLTLDSATSSFGSNLKSPSLWSITMLDSTVHKILEHYVGLDLSKPSAITVDLPLVRSPTPVVLAIIGYIVVVLLWSSHIKRAGLKPRLQDPVWLQTLVIVHNCFLCFLSFYMGWGIITEARHHRYRHSS